MIIIKLDDHVIRIVQNKGEKLVVGSDIANYLNISSISGVANRYCNNKQKKIMGVKHHKTNQVIHSTVINSEGLLNILLGLQKIDMAERKKKLIDEVMPILKGKSSCKGCKISEENQMLKEKITQMTSKVSALIKEWEND